MSSTLVLFDFLLLSCYIALPMAVENPYPQNPEFVFSFGAHNPDNTIVLSNAYFEIESYIAQGLHVAYIIEDASASR